MTYDEWQAKRIPFVFPIYTDRASVLALAPTRSVHINACIRSYARRTAYAGVTAELFIFNELPVKLKRHTLAIFSQHCMANTFAMHNFSSDLKFVCQIKILFLFHIRIHIRLEILVAYTRNFLIHHFSSRNSST